MIREKGGGYKDKIDMIIYTFYCETCGSPFHSTEMKKVGSFKGNHFLSHGLVVGS